MFLVLIIIVGMSSTSSFEVLKDKVEDSLGERRIVADPLL
jgi:hypothetical protein